MHEIGRNEDRPAEHTNWRRLITMVPVLLVLLLALILFGAGFALKALWWVAVVVLVVWALGFVIRPAGNGGSRGRWYRW
jgi:membrane protein YdbS with pleckstrin-like domain